MSKSDYPGRWNTNISYSIEGGPLGTGGAIKKAMESFPEKQYLVVNGDTLLSANLNALLQYYSDHRSMVTIALTHVEDTGRYGRIEISESGLVSNFEEKRSGGPGYINSGTYLFERTLMDYILDGHISLEQDVLPYLPGKGLYGYQMEGYFIDIGVPNDYLNFCGKTTQEHFLKQKPTIETDRIDVILS